MSALYFAKLRRLAAATGSPAATVLKVWDLEEKREVFSSPPVVRFADLAFSPDGKRLAHTVHGNSMLTLWDLEAPDKGRAVGPGSFPLAFSADGALVASTTRSGIEIRDAASGKTSDV